MGMLFNTNVVIVEQETKKTPHPLLLEKPISTAYIYHTPGHFNYLVPKQENNILINNIRQSPVANNKKSDTNSLFLWGKEKATHLANNQQSFKICPTISREIDEIVNVTKTLNEKLMSSNDSSESNNDKVSLLNNALDQSNNLVTVVKSKLNVTNPKIDSLLKRKLEQDVLKLNLSTPQHNNNLSADEALARTLQNEEILVFLQKNISFFGTQPQPVTSNKQPNKNPLHRK